LISNIGSYLSLFVGCSFVSFFEVIEILIEIFIIFFQKTKTIQQTDENKSTTIGHLNKNELEEIFTRFQQECIRNIEMKLQNDKSNQKEFINSKIQDFDFKFSQLESEVEQLKSNTKSLKDN
jgi:hypothetical protein